MKVTLLLKQHVGGPCTPIVAAGDTVKRGQKVAEPNGLGANIHSSVTGTVLEVTETAIIIDAAAEQSEAYEPIPETATKLDAIREAGVIGAGGAGFPTHVKLGTKVEGGVVIANAAECEPILEHNISYLEKDPAKVIKGLQYVMEIVGAARGLIAIKVKNMGAIKALTSTLKAMPAGHNIEVKILPDMYPAGDERVIVRELLGEVLAPGALPGSVGAVICNVESLKNIALAIDDRKPVIDKDLTVAGMVGDKQKVFFNVPVGVEVKEYIDKAGGISGEYGEVLLGGPFTGKRGSLNAPVVKNLGGIILTAPFTQDNHKFGILACECGAQEERLTQIVESMGGTVIASQKCKRMVEVNGRYRCEKPGTCPGQAETVLKLKKAGAEVILTGTCSD